MRIYFSGGGHCTEYVARRLIKEGHDLVIMEQNESRAEELQEGLDAQIITGDASDIGNWRHAGLERADMFVSCTNSDERNVLACLIANDMAPDAVKILRLRTPDYAEWDRMLRDLKVRVDRVVHPEFDIVKRILSIISVPGISDIRDFADGRVRAFGLNIEADGPLAGQNVRQLNQGANNARIGVILRGAGAIIPPDSEETLLAGDHIYVVTTRETFDETLAYLGLEKRSRVREVFVVGGGEVGLELAKALESEHVSVKLYETDRNRCDRLAEELPQTTVIHADGTAQETMLRGNLEGADAFVALTGDDDANLIACLLAKRMGVAKVIPQLNRLNHLQLAQRLGINSSVSPRIKAADALLESIRRGGVLSVRTLGEEEAEAIELEVPDHSRYTDRPLHEIDFPSGTLVAAIAPPGEEAIIPDRDAVINPGDRVVFFVHEHAIRRLESEILAKSLSV